MLFRSHTKKPGDVGKFKAPTLRNIALTAPYMHDGSIATLAEVVDHYAAGGRAIERGPWAGAGRENAAKDALVHGFLMTSLNRADLVAFLESLTDEGVLRDPRFGDPWAEGRRPIDNRPDPEGAPNNLPHKKTGGVTGSSGRR